MIKKLTHEYVEAQTLPFEAWDWLDYEKPVKVQVVRYDLAEGASVKTIVFSREGSSQKSRASVDFLYQDEQSILEEMAIAKVEQAERPEYDTLLEQRNKLYEALYNMTNSYTPVNDECFDEAIAAMRLCKLSHREDRTGLLK